MEFLRNVEFSITAEKRIDDIVNYLENVFSEKVKFNFLKKLHLSINAIKIDPKSFPISEYNITVRKCVVTKQTTIFYRFNSKKITIVSVFDTRQNPLKIKKIK